MTQDNRQAAEHNQWELEQQQQELLKKQAENTSTYKSMGYKNTL
jgi:hypothetical protein